MTFISNSGYLGTGKLDLSNDHPSEIKHHIKNVIREKYEHLAWYLFFGDSDCQTIGNKKSPDCVGNRGFVSRIHIINATPLKKVRWYSFRLPKQKN
jgi:hypothetical protein